MLEDLLVLAFCFLMALASFGIAGWEFATHRFDSMDGLWFTLICLALGCVFGGNVLWSIRTREVQRIIAARRKQPAEPVESEQHRSAAA